jgi:alpha/beta superfamily hydrolase
MPVLAADAPRDAYRDLFDDAGTRIAAALAWLRAKGFANVAIVSHSMGASMTDAFLARADATAIVAWAPVGMLVAFTAPPRMPVLDVVAERDFPEALAAARSRALALPRDACSKSLSIAGTDHYMDGATTPLAEAIRGFLDRVFAGACGGAAPR